MTIKGYRGEKVNPALALPFNERSTFMSGDTGGISQSNSGSMTGGMQAAIGNYNTQSMSVESSNASNILTQSEVVELLEQIERLIQEASLPEAVKGKATKYIEAAKTEAKEAEPDKQLISKSLERVTRNLEEVDKAVDAGQRIIGKVSPLIIKIAGWLGTAAGSLWAILP